MLDFERYYRRFNKYVQKTKDSPHFRWGAPFMVVLLMASLGLNEGQKLILQKRDKSRIMLTEEEKEEFKKSHIKSMTQEYREYRKKSDLNSWENIRGPRPWEDSKSVQDQQRKRMGLLTSEETQTEN